MVSDEAAALARTYPQTVYWSDEDQLFIGICPPLFYGGCHGDDPADVLFELAEIIGDNVQLMLDDGKELPDPRASTADANPCSRFAS